MANKKISELPAATEPLDDADLVEVVQGGINKKAPKSAFGGGGAVDSVNGQTGTVVLVKADVGLGNADNTSDANKPVSTAQQTALDAKVDEETWATLTFASPVAWDLNNRQSPLAVVTATGNFTLNMTNLKDGAHGCLLVITNTASAVQMTFDSDFTNKMLNVTMAAYEFRALTGQEYYCDFRVRGTTIEWVIGDIAVVALGARVQRAASQTIASHGTNLTAIEYDTENNDDSTIFSIGLPSRLTVPGTGNKRAIISGWIQWDSSATGERRWQINKNGSAASFSDGGFGRKSADPSTVTLMNVYCMADCVGGDYFELMQFQNSTANRALTASIQIKIENRQ